MNPRVLGWVVFGVVLGFVGGQALGRRELRELKLRHATLERQLGEVERPSLLGALWSRLDERREDAPPPAPAQPAHAVSDAGALPGVALEGAREGQGDVAVIGQVPAGAAKPTSPAPPTEPQPLGAEPAPVVGAREARAERDASRRERFRGRLAQFDSLAAAQRIRALASRTALIDQAKLEPAQVAELDKSVKDMNDKLAGYGEEVIDQMTDETAPSASDALGLGHDVSGILFEGQQKLDGLVGERTPEVDASAREIWNYIDLDQWRPFAKQKLDETSAAGAAKPAPSPAPAAAGAAGTSGASP